MTGNESDAGSTRGASLSDGALEGADPPGLRRGDWVEHFRLGPRLGRGGMGEVFLARDAVLGRSVALKFIRADRLSSAAAERFRREAQAMAGLSHENVVAVHDLREHRGRPYLVLEYVRGRSLAERLAERRLAPAEATRIALACARALRAAHARGLVHRDLKPSNVMLGEDGRARVVDFGLAEILGPEVLAPAGEGTPRYMAPEQARGGLLTPAVDVWALGLVLLEMLAGEPIEALRVQGERRWEALAHEAERRLVALPAHAALVVSCLEEDPARRISSGEACDRLEPLIREAPRARLEDESPFPGLEGYGEAQAVYFGGREAEVDAFVERMERQAVLAVLGASGIGKSSFVAAGVAPRLKETEPWRLLRLRPGERPLHALAQSAADAPGDVERLAQLILRAPEELGLALYRRAALTGERLLLFVDQLEELYTHPVSEAERRAFEGAVSRAASEADGAVRVVFTLREDFLGRAAQSGSLGPALEQPLTLSLPSRGLLAAALRGALVATGHRFEDPRIVEEMIGEVWGQPSALPLLSFACRALWAERDRSRRLLLQETFVRLGGVAGALAAEADRVLDALGVAEQRTASVVLTRLIGPEGTSLVSSRHQVLEGLGERAEGVLQTLERARLLRVREGSAGAEPTVELAHEALIRSWKRLDGWLAATREERVLAAELDAEARRWRDRGARPEETWPIGRVVETRARMARLTMTPSAEIQAFLGAGERRERGRRWVRRALTAVAAAVGVLGVAAALVFRAQAERLRLARDDRGRFELRLAAFTFVGDSTVAVELAGLDPELAFFAPSPGEPALPGSPLPEVRVVRSDTGYDVEAPAVAAFLRIRRRSGEVELCHPVWVPLTRLPGYAERAQAPRLMVWVPDCAASRAGTVEIPAGEYISGGLGEPPTPEVRSAGAEERRSLPRYFIDRLEVTNRRFAAFARMAALTGIAMPNYPDIDPVRMASEPDYPVSKVDQRTARAYCLFLGKALPAAEEWEKAARGGLTLNGGAVLNPEPRRNVPWGGRDLSGLDRANLGSAGDGADGPSPVGRYPLGASPYGVLDLVGNVREWMDTAPSGLASVLRATRGGDWDSDPAKNEHLIAYRSSKDRASADYGQGFRCVLRTAGFEPEVSR